MATKEFKIQTWLDAGLPYRRLVDLSELSDIERMATWRKVTVLIAEHLAENDGNPLVFLTTESLENIKVDGNRPGDPGFDVCQHSISIKVMDWEAAKQHGD